MIPQDEIHVLRRTLRSSIDEAARLRRERDALVDMILALEDHLSSVARVGRTALREITKVMKDPPETLVKRMNKLEFV